jgi:hypothetical protein
VGDLNQHVIWCMCAWMFLIHLIYPCVRKALFPKYLLRWDHRTKATKINQHIWSLSLQIPSCQALQPPISKLQKLGNSFIKPWLFKCKVMKIQRLDKLSSFDISQVCSHNFIQLGFWPCQIWNLVLRFVELLLDNIVHNSLPKINLH